MSNAAKQPLTYDIWRSSLLETTIYRMSEKPDGLLSGKDDEAHIIEFVNQIVYDVTMVFVMKPQGRRKAW